MANPCTPQPCPANQKWNSRRCKCDVDLEEVYREANTERPESYKRIINKSNNQGSGFNVPIPTDPNLGAAKKGGSVIKGSLLRRKASTKGLRTSKKH